MPAWVGPGMGFVVDVEVDEVLEEVEVEVEVKLVDVIGDEVVVNVLLPSHST